MAFLDKAGLQTLTNKLVQGDAIKVASSRGNTVKNVIDNITRECSDVENPQTMTLEDETGHFMIGKGKDIDVSGDVEVGKMAFAFKGVTLQNCFDIFFRSVSYGATKKNNLITLDGTRAYSQANFLFPINTTYTVYIKVVENSLPKGSQVAVNPYGGKLGKGYYEAMNKIKNGETGLMPAFTYEAKDCQGVSRNFWFEVGSHKLGGHLAAEFLILQGERTKKEIPPFFTGIKSSFETEEDRKIVHTGKNLIDEKNPFDSECYYFYNTGERSYSSNYRAYKIKVRAGVDYVLQGKQNNPDPYQNTHVVYYTSNDEFITGELFNVGGGENLKKITPPKNSDYLIISNGLKTTNFQIEEGRGATEYAPYIKEEKIIELDEPLRSLPNGVCDEIAEDGKLIRRVGKTVFSGVEKWNFWGNDSPEYVKAYTFDNLPNKKTVGVVGEAKSDNLICDKLPISKRSSLSQNNYPCIFRGTSYIGLSIKKSELAEPYDDNSVKQWIQKNNLTIYYEIEEKESSNEQFKFNVSQHNRIDISSSIAPITIYKVPLNRAAQIDNSIKTIQELKQRIELLEQAYDNHFLESQYKLSLLKLEHHIESEEI